MSACSGHQFSQRNRMLKNFHKAGDNYSQNDFVLELKWEKFHRLMCKLWLSLSCSLSRNLKCCVERRDLKLIINKINMKFNLRPFYLNVTSLPLYHLSFNLSKLIQNFNSLNPIAEIGNVTTSAMNPCLAGAPLATNLTLKTDSKVRNKFRSFSEFA